MSTTLEPKPLTHAERGRLGGLAAKEGRYTPEDIERGLQALATLGTTTAASKATGIPPSTLTFWRRERHADRYQEIRQQVMPRIHAQIATESEDLARRYTETEHALLKQFRDTLHELKPADQASAVRNMATARAISIDKANILRGKPTAIIENRDIDVLLRKLEQGGIVEGTAVEVEATST